MSDKREDGGIMERTTRRNSVTCKKCGLTLKLRARYPKGMALGRYRVEWMQGLQELGWGVTLGIDNAYCPKCCKPVQDDGNAHWRQLQADLAE